MEWFNSPLCSNRYNLFLSAIRWKPLPNRFAVIKACYQAVGKFFFVENRIICFIQKYLQCNQLTCFHGLSYQ